MYLNPIGALFFNAMFVIIIPLVFLSLTNAITSTREIQRLGKILGSTLVVFILTATVIACLSYFVVSVYNPFIDMDTRGMTHLMKETVTPEKRSFGEVLAQTFTVDEFIDLFNKLNLLPLIIFSLFCGIAITLVGEPAELIVAVLKAANVVVMKLVEILMKVSPIGLGCYFAYTIGNLGSQILGRYMSALVLYLLITVIYYVGMFSFYVVLAGGKVGVSGFWQKILAPSLTALSTSSSAACIPVNLVAEKNGCTKRYC